MLDKTSDNPLIPNRDVRRVLISHQAHERFLKLLDELNITYLMTPQLLDFPIGHHPDILWHPLGLGRAVAYREWEIKVEGYEVLPSTGLLFEDYPKDIALNLARLGNYYLGKQGAIDQTILEDYESRGLDFVAINQGYAKCSIFYLSEEAIMTTDKKIHQLVQALGFRSYLLPSGGIKLDPYDTGFIGGTGGLIGPGKALFYGDLNYYRYKDLILEIFEKEGLEAYYPRGIEFMDLGSILAL